MNQAHADLANRGDQARDFQARWKHGRQVALGRLNQNRADRRARLGTVRSNWINQSHPEGFSRGNCLAVRERLGTTAKTKQQCKKSGAGRAKVGPKKGSRERIRLSTSITHEV